MISITKIQIGKKGGNVLKTLKLSDLENYRQSLAATHGWAPEAIRFVYDKLALYTTATHKE